MTDIKEQNNNTSSTQAPKEASDPAVKTTSKPANAASGKKNTAARNSFASGRTSGNRNSNTGKNNFGNKRGGSRDGRGGRGNRRFERQKPEFDQKIIDIRRVTRVVAGGRRFGFSVAVVAGNRNGRVGVGTGKAGDTSLAIEKAFKNAKKNMITVNRNKKLSIPNTQEVKYSTARIILMPAPGRGLVAGSSVRTVLDLAGVKDVGAKVISRSKNKLNIARAAIKALQKIEN